MMGMIGESLGSIETLYCPNMPDQNIGNRNFSYNYNLRRYKNKKWTQAGYAYRKYNDLDRYHTNYTDSSKAIISDAFMYFRGKRFPYYTHGPEGFNVAYGDSSVAWLPDSTRYAASARQKNVHINRNDTAIWQALFDR